MSRAIRVCGAILLALTIALPARASHVGSGCTQSAAATVSTVVDAECTFNLSCPSNAPHTCRFRLLASATGGGYVAGRLFVPGLALPYTYCTGVYQCGSSRPDYLVASGQTKTLRCAGGDAAVLFTLSCSASPM